ncbi:putative ribokinase, partial [Coemansia asiatica]
HAGGKGANASVAAARAGGNVFTVGKIGPDGLWVRDLINSSGANTEHISVVTDALTARAIIQVDAQGENSIVLFPGANDLLTEEDAKKAFAQSSPGDWLLLTNETTGVAEAIRLAHEKGMRILWNAAPMASDMIAKGEPVDLVDVLVVNETELCGLAEQLEDIDIEEKCLDKQKCMEVARQVMKRLGNQVIAVTLGKEGSVALVRRSKTDMHAIPTSSTDTKQFGNEIEDDDIAEISMRCAPVATQLIRDTTGAGDTWVGYFAAELARTQGNSPESIGSLASLTPAMVEQSMFIATFASGLTVTRMGAMPSIPEREEVEKFVKTRNISI